MVEHLMKLIKHKKYECPQSTDIVETWRFRNIQKHETPNKIDRELQIDLIKYLSYYFPSVKRLQSPQDLQSLNYNTSPFTNKMSL